MLERELIDDEIRSVLGRIHDPCSIAAGRPVSVLDMGLVRGWVLDEGGVLTVTFCVTFAGCTMAPHFAQAAADDLAKLPGVERVETVIDTTFVWTPDKMKAAPLEMRGRPQSWRERVTP
ncbi:MAG: metal-sulfur cluster assembly factor [Erythrobacter sp.]